MHRRTSTTGVVYVICCPCGLKYVGMTTRELRIRLQEHIRDIRTASKLLPTDLEKLARLKPVPKHFLEYHAGRWQDLRAYGIDKIILGARGGDTFKRLERIELKWIVKLDTVSPLGLNEKLSFSPYI